MRNTFLAILSFSALCVTAQNKLNPSERITITGKVKKETIFRLADLDTFKKATLTNVVMIDAKGEAKETVKSLKGILLKDLFQSVEFTPENHKALNKFYLIFSATDGFKLVLSYNEIFHETYNNFYLVTEIDGRKLQDISDRLLILDINNSKAHERVKALNQITVTEAE